jgi:hypothetical protein
MSWAVSAEVRLEYLFVAVTFPLGGRWFKGRRARVYSD